MRFLGAAFLVLCVWNILDRAIISFLPWIPSVVDLPESRFLGTEPVFCFGMLSLFLLLIRDGMATVANLY